MHENTNESLRQASANGSDAQSTTREAVTLTRTGRMVPFLELHIGEAFFYEGDFWTRTDTHTGTDLRPRGHLGAPAPYGATYGSCSFGIQPDTLMVEAVSLAFSR